MMEENKLSFSELKKLTQIYNKLNEINSADKFLKFISNSVRDEIIISVEKIKKILYKNEE
jgi:hypothetical protein